MSNPLRHNLLFDPIDKKQQLASDFLNKIPRSQSRFISNIVYKFLMEHGIHDIKNLSNSDARKIAFELNEDVSALPAANTTGFSINDVATLLSAVQTRPPLPFPTDMTNSTLETVLRSELSPPDSQNSIAPSSPKASEHIIDSNLEDDDNSEDEDLDMNLANKLLADNSLFM